jgi:hypothetical protein
MSTTKAKMEPFVTSRCLCSSSNSLGENPLAKLSLQMTLKLNRQEWLNVFAPPEDEFRAVSDEVGDHLVRKLSNLPPS